MPIDFDKMFTQLNEPQKPKEVEHQERTDNVRQLIHDIVGPHAEYFTDPANRLDFLKGQTAKSFFYLSRYINAKLRGEKPHQLRLHHPEERRGGQLPMLHTPSASDKHKSFAGGFTAIQEYLNTTEDSVEKQVEGVAMATEALIIWVHPFVDGNGRTSRFMAKLIEDGGVDTDSLVEETASSANRPSYYKVRYATKEGRLEDANNDDLILDDDEREQMRAGAEQLPSDVKGMYLSIKRLLEDDDVRAKSIVARIKN
ncbi:MAG: hypothetical protein JWM52_428 [Candidatus Saccharibacteria bacterium]|nr:hypothetical protein [Candidatus Saccharibacteria bacterium]